MARSSAELFVRFAGAGTLAKNEQHVLQTVHVIGPSAVVMLS
jgi:hypothetical protein